MFKRIFSYIKPTTLSSAFRVIDANVTSNGIWVSESMDPHFVFKRPLTKGWYVIELRLTSEKRLNAGLYLEGEAGFSEENSLTLSLRSGRMYKRFFYLKKESSRVRFDPMDAEGEFSIEHFRIQPVTRKFALSRMRRKLGNVGFSQLADSCIYDWYQRSFKQAKDTKLDYQRWLQDEINLPSPEGIKEDVFFSVVIPVYKPDLALLREAISSIQAQSYKYYEICLADDFSEDDTLTSYLNGLSNKHSNVNIISRVENGHISLATNSALTIASGEYVVFMDQDDLLAPDALLLLANEIINNPSALLLYSDEDKIDEFGNRYEPHFKPEFSPFLLLGQNYVNHLTVMKKSLVDELGGLREGYEGAQDHDLLVRALPKLNESNVKRIPRVLYHWRAIEGSTALSAGEKEYTNFAALKAVQCYLNEHRPGAVALSGRGPNTIRIKNPTVGYPFVSILIPTRDRLDVLMPCIESILSKTRYQHYEILILDNDSQDQKTHSYFDEITKRDSRVRIIECPGEFNFSRINNLGVDSACGEYVALVNNDIEVIEGDWLDEMLGWVSLPEIGCVGAKLLYPNNTIQHGGVILGIGGVAGHSHLHLPLKESGYFEKMNLVHEVSAVTAACLLVKKSIYDEVSGLDETLKVAFNDVDFCIKVREAGYKNLFTPFATLYHHESISRGYEDTPEKQERFNREVALMQEKWGEILTEDPYYNPNFELMAEPYHLA